MSRLADSNPRKRLSDGWRDAPAGACKWCGRRGRFYPAQPGGYVAWFAWAEKKSQTHHQERCPNCQRLSIWRRDPGSKQR